MNRSGWKRNSGPSGQMGNMPEASWRKSTPNDSKVFRENEYRNALNRHYGRLLKLSKKTVGQPSEREVVMLGKIKKLEAQLQETKKAAKQLVEAATAATSVENGSQLG